MNLPADFDEDGDVDGADLTVRKAGFGTIGIATHRQGDADGDRKCGWHRSSSLAAAVVPEPGAFLLFIVASG